MLSEIFSKIRDISAPFLQRLADETSETVIISTLKKYNMINISVLKSPYRLQVYTTEGDLMPVYCTAVGKILLSSLIDEEFKRVFNAIELVKYTKNTITDLEKLQSELTTVGKNDIAFDNEEYELDVRSVATPVRNNIGRVVAAIGIIGPANRLNEKKVREIVPIAKLYGRRISEEMVSNNKR
jgi:DNA-binding IclR family transcriptional regulator